MPCHIHTPLRGQQRASSVQPSDHDQVPRTATKPSCRYQNVRTRHTTIVTVSRTHGRGHTADKPNGWTALPQPLPNRCNVALLFYPASPAVFPGPPRPAPAHTTHTTGAFAHSVTLVHNPNHDPLPRDPLRHALSAEQQTARASTQRSATHSTRTPAATSHARCCYIALVASSCGFPRATRMPCAAHPLLLLSPGSTSSGGVNNSKPTKLPPHHLRPTHCAPRISSQPGLPREHPPTLRSATAPLAPAHGGAILLPCICLLFFCQ